MFQDLIKKLSINNHGKPDPNQIRLFMLGDVYAKPGRRCLAELLPGLRKSKSLDLVVANSENAAGGLGLSAKLAEDILGYGVDVITTGNHVWKKKDLVGVLKTEPRVIRPLNYPSPAPGCGYAIRTLPCRSRIAVVNLEGRVYGGDLDCPFKAMDRLLDGPLAGIKTILVDFHAEATSEKKAMAYHLKGRVSALVGTHTHVQTADQRILDEHTAYMTDLGMTGPHDSVIGMDPETALYRFKTARPNNMKAATKDPRLQGAFITIDKKSGKALKIERLDLALRG
ncbi:TIGR00282 family metallophosphoesterase [Dethiosulfatarculus sandiegensis]|uniref:TIGR00282 family metallophosphoesterase n=1 Tax=Dethiosulfatarculus sandiegensis TaxID=1429043 RepID=UPI000AC641B7|nr:TIGR00282 family metallophosphoesterase [Dethiosulfatarculus sandiegensis]